MCKSWSWNCDAVCWTGFAKSCAAVFAFVKDRGAAVIHSLEALHTALEYPQLLWTVDPLEPLWKQPALCVALCQSQRERVPLFKCIVC